MVDHETLQAWRKQLRGPLFGPDDTGYDEVRRVFNGMVDKRPEVIVRCAGVADVMAAVRFAREADLPVAIRGGGHGVTGSAVGDGGLVVDLSAMQSVRVDPERRIARAEGGTTWGGFDHETQAFGLATTGGIVPSTGIAGLTLGGGIGYLNRKYGLACDNLLSVDVVTAEGQWVTASADENPELFWGLRGGGGNFGVVTSFEYRLHPVGPVLGGELVFPLDQAKEMLRFYRDWSSAAPDELRVDATLLLGPEGPALGFIVCWCGEIEEGKRVLQPLRSRGTPLLDSVAPVPYEVVQNLLTEVFRPGLRHYWKAGFMRSFSDAAIEAMVDSFAGDLPSPFAAIAIEHLGGAVGRVGSQDTAFAHRHAQHSVLVIRMWQDAVDSDANVEWGRRCFRTIAPFLEEGAYVNYLGDEGEARIRAAYGANYPRLAALKQRYDPTNLFRFNQNFKVGPGVPPST